MKLLSKRGTAIERLVRINAWAGIASSDMRRGAFMMCVSIVECLRGVRDDDFA